MTTFFSLTDLGLLASQSQLLQQWLSYMQAIYPGYNPSPANLEYVQAVIFASWAADLASQASEGATELFSQFGQQVLDIPMELGQSAVAVVTVIATDARGHTLPQGTQFLLDNQYGFQSVSTVVIPPGQTSATVTLASVTAGSIYNGAGAQAAALNQYIDWVLSVTTVSPATNGKDPEDPDDYLTRLTNDLQLLAPRPITATDYASFATNFSPAIGTDQQEVGRATSIDGYDPVPGYNTPAALAPGAGTNPGTYNNEREVTVCVTDSNGYALNQDTITAVQAWFQSLREANFLVNVISPTYSNVYVTCQVRRTGQFPASTVQSAVQGALVSFLSPSAWGTAQDQISGTSWTNTTTIYESVLASVIQNVPGVASIVSGTLCFDVNPNPTNQNDLVLPGPVALPTTQNGLTIPLTAVTVVN